MSPKAPASSETKLYGHWQTVEWIPPQAKDGVVPKNERGNVLCPPLAHALPLVRSCLQPAHSSHILRHCSLILPALLVRVLVTVAMLAQEQFSCR